MKSWKVEAAIIAVGLLLLGIMVKGGINNFVNKDRVVSVKGLAEMEVPADKVVWPLVYKDIGNDPALLYANMEKKNAAIVGFLENNGIEKEEISIAKNQTAGSPGKTSAKKHQAGKKGQGRCKDKRK